MKTSLPAQLDGGMIARLVSSEASSVRGWGCLAQPSAFSDRLDGHEASSLGRSKRSLASASAPSLWAGLR